MSSTTSSTVSSAPISRPPASLRALSRLQTSQYATTTTKSVHHVTNAVTTPLKYLGFLVHSCGDAMHPAQYPMKNTALTTERLVLPFAFEAVSESSGLMTAVMHEASHEAAIMPQPAVSESFRSSTLPIRGGMMSARTTCVRLLGNSQQPNTPIQRRRICTAPEGAVYSIV